MAESKKETGLIQPISVRPLGEGYEIIDGHRRVRAMKKLEHGQIMAIIKDVLEAQWELYRKVLFSKMGRKELSVLLKKSDKTPVLKTWRMKASGKKVTISLETGKMDQPTRDRFMKLISEKMKVISDSL